MDLSKLLPGKECKYLKIVLSYYHCVGGLVIVVDGLPLDLIIHVFLGRVMVTNRYHDILLSPSFRSESWA